MMGKGPSFPASLRGCLGRIGDTAAVRGLTIRDAQREYFGMEEESWTWTVWLEALVSRWDGLRWGGRGILQGPVQAAWPSQVNWLALTR